MRRWWTGLLLGATVSLAVSARELPLRRPSGSRSLATEAGGFYAQPLGVCEDYPEDTTTLAKIRADFETMRELGVRQLRFAFGWDGIEIAPGHYDWGFWDDFVALAQTYDIELIPYVCYSPEWSNAGGENFWRTPPQDLQRFADFMEVIVRRYKGRIHSWELWNEPDIEAYWLGTADAFAHMIQLAAPAVRRADPEAVIVLGGMSHGRGPFFDRLIQMHHLDQWVDVLNLHGYNETWLPATTEDYPSQIRAFGALLPPGPQPDIWLAEFGYSDWRFAPAQVSQWGVDAYYAYEHTPAYQAISFFKQQLMAREAGNLSLSAWYRLRDLPPTTGVIGDDNNKHLGLLDVSGRPKPAWHALRFYARLYGRPLRSRSAEIKRLTPAGSAVVSAFEDRQGRLLLAAWLPSPRPGSLPHADGLARDEREESLTLELPGSYAQLRAYSALGEARSFSGQLEGRRLSGLRLRGGELFVAELTPAEFPRSGDGRP